MIRESQSFGSQTMVVLPGVNTNRGPNRNMVQRPQPWSPEWRSMASIRQKSWQFRKRPIGIPLRIQVPPSLAAP